MAREIVGRALVNGVLHTYVRMTNSSRFCASCPEVIVIATYHASTFPARRSNHDSARDTQQDTRGNVDEQNQECPVGVSVSRDPRESRCPSRSSRNLTSFRKTWRRGGAVFPARNFRMISSSLGFSPFNLAAFRLLDVFFSFPPPNFAPRSHSSSPLEFRFRHFFQLLVPDL